MIPFKDIELQDKELITSFTLNSPRRNCDLSFSNLCSWRFLYNTKFAIMDGFLLLKFWADGELVYMMPIGNGDLNKVLDALIEDANREGEPFCLLGICAGMCSELETFMPGRFQFTADRDYADYVYLRSDLATLSGKKFQAKRNHINKFKKTYNNNPWIEDPVAVIEDNTLYIYYDYLAMSSNSYSVDITYIKFPTKIENLPADGMSEIPEYM